MGEIKVRKIGNSLGGLFPKEWNLKEGDIIPYTENGNQIILDLDDRAKAHDRELIEESFASFESGKYLSQEEMKKKYGEVGWGE